MVLNSYFLPYIELFRVVSQYACGIFRCGQYLSLYSHHLAWYLAQIGLHTMFLKYCFCSVAQSCPTLRPHGQQHARLPRPSPSPGICSNSRPLSRRCHPTISTSVAPFSTCPQMPICFTGNLLLASSSLGSKSSMPLSW